MKVVEGIHGTIFAYGQTSSGKTHTMKGTIDQPGVIPLALTELFAAIRQEQSRQFMVRAAYLEVYNETVNDLLNASNTNLEIRESIERGTFVLNLTEVTVSSEEEALELLVQGEANRKVGETSMNEQSSRSHTVFQVHVESVPQEDADISPVRLSYLNLVDLAGSEGVQKTKAEDMRQREGSNINKSLLSLSSVIQKLSEAQSRNIKAYINFRDSKMTRLLQTSLLGNSKTVVICNVTQAIKHITETTNTLNFGLNAKRIKLQARPNEVITTESQLRQAQEETRRLKITLEDTEGQVHAKEADLMRMKQMECEKDQYYQDLQLRLESENEELKEQVRKMQTKIEKSARSIMNSAGKADSRICTPQSASKYRSSMVTLSPEATIHTLESYLLEKDRKITGLEQQLAHMTQVYEERYQNLLMDNNVLQDAFQERQRDDDQEDLRSKMRELENVFGKKEFEFIENESKLRNELDEQTRERHEIEEIAKDYEVQLEQMKQSMQNGLSSKEKEIKVLTEASQSQSQVSLQLQNQLLDRTKIIETLSSQCAKATEDCNTANLKLKQAEEAINVLEGRAHSFEELAEELYTEHEKVQRNLSNAELTITALSQQIQDLTANNEQIQGENAQLTVWKSSAMAENARLQNELLKGVSDQKSALSSTNDLLTEVQRVQGQLEIKAQEVKQAEMRTETMREEMERIKEDWNACKGHLETEQLALAESEAKVAHLEPLLSAKLSEIATLQDQVETASKSLSEARIRIDELEKHLEVTSRAEEISSLKQECSSALEENRHLKATLLTVHQELRHKEDQVTDLECQLKSLLNSDWETRAKSAEEKLLHLEEDVNMAAHQVRIENSERRKEHSREILSLKTSLEEAETRIRTLETAVTSKEEALEQVHRQMNYKRSQENLMDERVKSEMMTSERYQLQLQVQCGILKVKELEQYIQKLKEQINKTQAEVDAKRTEVQMQQARIRELERKTERLEDEILVLEENMQRKGRTTPLELMPRRVERQPVFTPVKSQSQDDEEDVDAESDMKHRCNQQ